VGKVILKIGDMLLIQGKWSKLNLLKNNPDLIVTSTTETFSHEKKKPYAFVILLLGVAATVLDILPVSIAMLSAAILMVLTKILTMEQAYRSVEWRMIFLMAGILPLGTAMEKTGAANLIGSSVLSPIADIGIVPLVIMIFVVTVILCSAIPNIASAAIIGSIALEAGVSHGFDPHILMLAVAYGASTGFITPISQQSNMLVMSAGGYTFRDFLKVGMPLTIIMGITISLLLIFFY
jgi:di/tricarboxylate transporter